MRGRPPLGPAAKDRAIKFRVDRFTERQFTLIAAQMGLPKAKAARVLHDLGVRAYNEGRVDKQ